MADKIALFVGLANPGPEYEPTHHNAGAWYIEEIAKRFNTSLSLDKKFKGLIGKAEINGHSCRLLIPTTYMNLSGESVGTVARYFDIEPEQILVAHDELDLAPGTAKLKIASGGRGHNGISNIVDHLSSKRFYRLRIGIGRPKRAGEMRNYVLKAPSTDDRIVIDSAIESAVKVTEDLAAGNISQATEALHTEINLKNNQETN